MIFLLYDTIAITFSEAIATTTLTTSTGITSITGSLSGAFDLSNASGVWSVGDTVYTLTLDEDTDNDFIQNGETITVNLAATVTDVVGNTYSVTPVTSAAVSGEATVPTFTVSGTSNNNGNDTVTLTFSENMATSTITTALLQANTNITIDISDDAGNTAEYDLDLSNATIAWTGLDTAVITLNELADGAYLANGKYIGVTLIGVTDLVGNLEAGAEVYSAAITGESTDPLIIDDWALNMNLGTITLNFNEAMSTSTSPDTTKIAIEELNGAGGESYTLTGGTSTWNSYTSMTINLSITDLNALKLNTSIATSAANSYLKIIAGNLITDLAGNEIDLTNVTDGASINATTFTADTTAPSLVNWTLNMNTGSLVMNFDETVSTSTLAVGAITIQDAATGTTSYTLTDSATVSANGTQVNIALSLTDLNAIKNDLNLATSTDSSYLTLTASAIDDMNGNSVNAILDGSAMQVLSYTADATVPTVTDWTLNINTGAMVINFSETMDQTVDVDETKITIQQSNDTSTAGEYYTLTDSTSVWTDHNTLTITLSATDLNALKRDTSLAISSATSYLEIAATNLIVDVVGLDLSLTNVTDGACLNVSSFTADTTAPTIVSQTPVDGSTGEAITIIPTVTFSEAMDPTISYQNLIKLYRYSDNSLITSTVTYDTNTLTATIDPVNPLSNNTQYYIWVSGAKDMVGNYLTDYTTKADQEFTTVAISAPTVLSQTPIAGSTGQAITINPTITFSENMATSTINSSNVQLRKYTDDSMVNSSVTYSNKVATIYPTSSLLNNTQYYIWVSGAEDLDTNPVTAYTTKASQEFTTVAISAPTVLSQTPTTGSTDQVITIEPTITFSEDMATSTINSSNVQLRKYTDDSIVNSTITYSNKVATIHPVSSLSNNTQYYIWVSGAEDLDGNTVTAYTTKASQEFTTIAQADGGLEITNIATTKPYAVADDSYANGWAWKFTITVPTSETSFKMKFDTWRSGSNLIESGGNMRYYSAQATTATTSANAIAISTTGTYPTTAMTLTGDLDENTAGRQIEVYVEMKVPVGSSGGSYSTQYGILTN